MSCIQRFLHCLPLSNGSEIFSSTQIELKVKLCHVSMLEMTATTCAVLISWGNVQGASTEDVFISIVVCHPVTRPGTRRVCF